MSATHFVVPGTMTREANNSRSNNWQIFFLFTLQLFSCSRLICLQGICSTTEVWSGSTSQISWEKLKRYQYHHITSVSPSSVSNNRKISEIDTFSTPHNLVWEKEELMFDLFSHNSDLTSSNVRPLVRKLCHLNYSFLSVIILSAS